MTTFHCLDSRTLKWIASCSECGCSWESGTLQEAVSRTKHVCGEPSAADLYQLEDAAGFTAVAKVIGLPD